MAAAELTSPQVQAFAALTGLRRYGLDLETSPLNWPIPHRAARLMIAFCSRMFLAVFRLPFVVDFGTGEGRIGLNAVHRCRWATKLPFWRIATRRVLFPPRVKTGEVQGGGLERRAQLSDPNRILLLHDSITVPATLSFRLVHGRR